MKVSLLYVFNQKLSQISSLKLRYSIHTVKAYRTDLNIFNEYLNQNYDLSIQEANHSMIRSWLVEELNKGNSPRTVNRKITY